MSNRGSPTSDRTIKRVVFAAACVHSLLAGCRSSDPPKPSPASSASPTAPGPSPAMRSLEQLIDDKDPAWPIVEGMLARAKNQVEVLPVEREQGERTLVSIQVTTRSPMGTIAYRTGGLLVDHGWVRVLGSGHPRLPKDLAGWNFPDGNPARARLPGAFLVADDVLGGFFALNGGALNGPRMNVFYFAPDALRWEDTHHGYTEFLDFLFSGDLEKFYSGQRWRDWRQAVEALAGDRVFDFYPMLSAWSDGGIESRSRKTAPIAEVWRAYVAQ
jgi:hypothetical protein